MPRLFGDDSVAREAAILARLAELTSRVARTVPAFVSLEPILGRETLVETALVGQPLSRAQVRRQPATAIAAVTQWLRDLAVAKTEAPTSDRAMFEHLVERPLGQFAAILPPAAVEQELVKRTLALVDPLRALPVPLVVEHGDLSHPNLLELEGGGVGVLDWELANLHGLPAHDLFFFLTYVAFATARAETLQQQLFAFRRAFFEPQAWALPMVRAYAGDLEISPPLLTPLFVACWARYAAGLAERIADERHGAQAATAHVDERLIKTLRGNRFWMLWRHVVDHADELPWRRC